MALITNLQYPSFCPSLCHLLQNIIRMGSEAPSLPLGVWIVEFPVLKLWGLLGHAWDTAREPRIFLCSFFFFLVGGLLVLYGGTGAHGIVSYFDWTWGSGWGNSSRPPLAQCTFIGNTFLSKFMWVIWLLTAWRNAWARKDLFWLKALGVSSRLFGFSWLLGLWWGRESVWNGMEKHSHSLARCMVAGTQKETGKIEHKILLRCMPLGTRVFQLL